MRLYFFMDKNEYSQKRLKFDTTEPHLKKNQSNNESFVVLQRFFDHTAMDLKAPEGQHIEISLVRQTHNNIDLNNYVHKKGN